VPDSGVNDEVDPRRAEPGRSGHEKSGTAGAGRSSLQESSPALQEPSPALQEPPASWQAPTRPAPRVGRRTSDGAAHWIFPQALDTVRSLLMILVAALFTPSRFILQPFSIPLREHGRRTLLVGDFLMVNKSMLAPPGWWSWLIALPARPGRGRHHRLPLPHSIHPIIW